jgi:hypothetical protein
MKTFISFL